MHHSTIQQKRHARFGFYNIVSMVIALEIILGGNKSPKMFDGAGAITILKLIRCYRLFLTVYFTNYVLRHFLLQNFHFFVSGQIHCQRSHLPTGLHSTNALTTKYTKQKKQQKNLGCSWA